jgi:ribonuclease VapC
LSVVFDTEALLTFYLDETGAIKVQSYLERVQRGEISGYLSVVNLTEFVYIVQRRDADRAEEKEKNLRAFGLEIVPVLDNDLWRTAANLKAKHALSLADAFAAATAKIKRASLVVGRDDEYRQLDVSLIQLK